MTGLKPEFLPELFRAAATGAAEITLHLQKGDDPRLADYLHLDSSREMEVAILPFQSFLSGKGIPHMNSPELTAASNLFISQWKELADAAGQFLPTDDRLTLSAAVKGAADALIDALADKVDAKANIRKYNNLVEILSKCAKTASEGIEAEITRRKIQEETYADIKQAEVSKLKTGNYPPIVKGHYAHNIIGSCDRNSGLIEILHVGTFYVSPGNDGAWRVIRKLVESFDERGYEALERGWRNFFSSKKAAHIPKSYLAEGVRHSSALAKFIHSRGHRDGFFRFEMPD